MSSLIEPAGGRFTYAFDAAGRLASLVNAQSERATFAYNAAGRNTLRLPGNGTRSTLVYDAAGRTRAVRHATSGGANIAAFTYTYDDAGQRTQVVEASGDVTTWSYDNTYQLTRERRSGLDGYDVTYSYDPAGNRVLKIDSAARTTSTYNAGNRLLTVDAAAGATTYTYDNDGNRTGKREPSGDRTTMTWDYENQSTEVEQPAGGVTTFTYDGDRQRVQKEDAGGETDFLFEAQSILAEYDGLGAVQALYTHLPDEFGTLVAQHRGGDSSFYHFDALGSTAALTDDAEVITDTYVYYAFGAENASSGSTDNPFRWVGEQGYYQDSTLGLYNLRARDYDPAAAAFISEDPIGFLSGEYNLYNYVGNGPTIATDPSGLVTSEEIEEYWRQLRATIPADLLNGVAPPGGSSGPGLWDAVGSAATDLYIMATNPGATALGGATGTVEGFGMMLNVATFYRFTELNTAVDQMIARNGSAYWWANVAAHFGVYGTAGATALSAYLAAGLPTGGLGISFGGRYGFHMIFNVSSGGTGIWAEGTGYGLGRMWIAQVSPKAVAAAWKFSGVPILFPAAALPAASLVKQPEVHSCLSAACGAVARAYLGPLIRIFPNMRTP